MNENKNNENKLYLMSGAGNKFVVLDGRGREMRDYREVERIESLCREHGTDGLMILDTVGQGEVLRDAQIDSLEADFRMEFYNPDGSGGMMCGNGGRCIVAFADSLGIKPADGDTYNFIAPDGPHSAVILSKPTALGERGKGLPCRGGHGKAFPAPNKENCWTVRLGMIDVDGITPVLGGYFLNTGTRHFVKFVEDVDTVDIDSEGKALRWREEFAPEGANINFVQRCDGYLKVRTFEKGVEAETLACGTGITASAIAAYCADPSLSLRMTLQARSGDFLEVDFVAEGNKKFRQVHLTGPAEFI